ncbi:MAG: chemotaxis protein CheV [Proteobacteria bacterium]|nr:chemotaxis signal transduction protein CheV [Pseudomonadota bacterium]NOG58916.1 chemotaxis protein CheV [Pseudomonadota bacterium]
MAKILDNVNSRTQLVGRNRLELLLFRLDKRQRFGINVFKVREVIKCPDLTHAPQAHPVIRGIANMRGQTITVMDLAMAVGKPAIEDLENSFVIVAEYNRHIQGFLVGGVDKIVNMNWEEIKPPPKGMGNVSFLTAVTEVDNELVEIIDVEKVMADVLGFSDHIDEKVTEGTNRDDVKNKHVLVIDDSGMARKQIIKVLEQMDITYTQATNGKEGYDILLQWAEDTTAPITDKCSLVLSDVEMPVMDGYTLTKNIKEHPVLNELTVMLHSSLSGAFNESMVKKVGADDFIAKYDPTDLAEHVLTHLKIKIDNVENEQAA